MKINKYTLGISTLVLAGSAAVAALSPDAPVKAKLNIDDTPPIRTGELGGFAPVVEKVSPSVVSVIASKETHLTSSNGRMTPFGDLGELFNDPRLAPFFGGGNNRGNLQPEAPAPGPRAYGQGSGVVLTADGYILTNNHVIDDADKVEIAFDDSGRKYEAEVVGRDPQTDLAVLKIDSGGKQLPAATIGDSSQLKPGDTVLAIGNPFGLTKTVTSGIVSAIGRSNVGITKGGYENFIQTDASINPGNSGGALIDNRGRVVGINTAIFSRSGGNVGIGFAIPVNLAVDIADSLINEGEVQRGYLGVMLGALTPELAAALDVDQNGVLVQEVMPGTPASKAGIRNGDVITHYNGRPINDASKLRFAVGGSRPGDSGEFTVIRNGKKKVVNAELGKLPGRDEVAYSAGSSPKQESAVEKNFLDGVSIAALGDRSRAEYNVGDDITGGVVVTEVDPSSAAAEAGLRAGDVITEVARQSVDSVDDAIGARKASTGSALLLRVNNAQTGSRYLAVKVS